MQFNAERHAEVGHARVARRCASRAPRPQRGRRPLPWGSNSSGPTAAAADGRSEPAGSARWRWPHCCRWRCSRQDGASSAARRVRFAARSSASSSHAYVTSCQCAARVASALPQSRRRPPSLAIVPVAQADVRVGENYRLESDPNPFRGKDQVALAVNPSNPNHIVETQRQLPDRELRGRRRASTAASTWSAAVDARAAARRRSACRSCRPAGSATTSARACTRRSSSARG